MKNPNSFRVAERFAFIIKLTPLSNPNYRQPGTQYSKQTGENRTCERVEKLLQSRTAKPILYE